MSDTKSLLKKARKLERRAHKARLELLRSVAGSEDKISRAAEALAAALHLRDHKAGCLEALEILWPSEGYEATGRRDGEGRGP